MPFQHARHDILQATEHSSVVVTQEMAFRHAQRFAPSGWRSAHFAGLRRGDCATYWNRDLWRLHSAWTRQITWASFRAGHRFALATTFHGVGPMKGRRLAVVCVHSITKSLARNATFNRGMNRLGDLLSALRDRYRYVVVGGDWNRVWSKRRQFAGMGSASPSRSTGPRGGRVDYFEWTTPPMRYAGSRIIGNTYSDHNGTRIHLELR
jgi:hypothetical protein